MKKLLFGIILLFTVSLYGQYDYLEILTDTTELKNYKNSDVVLLEKFGAGTRTGGGLFRKLDSAYTEGTNAFNYLGLDGLQWVRLSYLNGTHFTAIPEAIVMSGVLITTGSYVVLAANSGRVHYIPNLAGDTKIALPAEADGLNYEFWYIGAAVETHDHDIDSESNTNFFIGGLSWLDTDAGDAADEVHLGIYSDGNSTSKIVIQNMAAGTWIKVVCDGTNWYVTGQILSDTIPTIEDQ